jgi:hypothetical protein
MQIDQITEIYTDERDCGADLDLPEYNAIKLETVSNGMESYVVMSTDRWALDEDGLAQLVRAATNLMQRVNTK